MEFRYQVYDQGGHLLTGRLESASQAEAERQLWGNAYLISRLEPVRGRRTWRSLNLVLFERVDPMEVAFLFRQLATCVRVGLPLVSALNLQRSAAGTQTLRRALAHIEEQIRGGSAVWAALADFPKLFPPLYVQIIKGGELSGKLESAFLRCAGYIEGEAGTRRQVQQALVYPVVVLLLAAAAVVVLTVVVLPAMANLFQQFNARLPLPTRLLIALVDFARSRGLWILAGLVLLFGVAFLLLRTPKGRLWRDRWVLRVPAFGKVARESALARFGRVLSAMVAAAVPLGEALEVVVSATGNRFFEARLREVKDRRLTGEGISTPLEDTGLFPPLLIQIVRLGEQAGNLAGAVEELARYYEAEVESSVRRFLSLLEPALIVGVGLVVGFIAVAVISPMYSIVGQIH